jgi:hypothetical protein
MTALRSLQSRDLRQIGMTCQMGSRCILGSVDGITSTSGSDWVFASIAHLPTGSMRMAGLVETALPSVRPDVLSGLNGVLLEPPAKGEA